MEFVQFTYKVTAFIKLTKAEHSHLMQRSSTHYDLMCKSISKPGLGSFLYSWSHSYEGKPDSHAEEWGVTSRHLNLLMKLLEMGREPIDAEMFFALKKIFDDIQTEHRRVNGLQETDHG